VRESREGEIMAKGTYHAQWEKNEGREDGLKNGLPARIDVRGGEGRELPRKTKIIERR